MAELKSIIAILGIAVTVYLLIKKYETRTVLIGVGLLILFRHRASLGGFNILCLWLQERYGLSAGKIQMGMDCSIVLSSALVTSWSVLFLSVFAAINSFVDIHAASLLLFRSFLRFC